MINDVPVEFVITEFDCTRLLRVDTCNTTFAYNRVVSYVSHKKYTACCIESVVGQPWTTIVAHHSRILSYRVGRRADYNCHTLVSLLYIFYLKIRLSVGLSFYRKFTSESAKQLITIWCWHHKPLKIKASKFLFN